MTLSDLAVRLFCHNRVCESRAEERSTTRVAVVRRSSYVDEVLSASFVALRISYEVRRAWGATAKPPTEYAEPGVRAQYLERRCPSHSDHAPSPRVNACWLWSAST